MMRARRIFRRAIFDEAANLMIQKIGFVRGAIRSAEASVSTHTPGFWPIGHAARAVSAAANLMLQLWTLGQAPG